MKALRRVAAGLALTVTSTTLGGVWYGRYYLTQELTPALQKVLSESLQRPVKLGNVSFITTRSVHFGRTQVLPTPTQKDFLTVDRLEINTDPWEYWRSGKLEVSANFIRPHYFLPLDAQGQGEGIPQIDIYPDLPQWLDLKTIDVKDGRLTLGIEATKRLVTIDRFQIRSGWQSVKSVQAQGKGEVRTAPWNETLTPDRLKAIVDQGTKPQGKISVKSDWNLQQNQGNLQLRPENVDLPIVSNFVQALPVNLRAGKVNGDVGLRFLGAKTQVQSAVKLTQGTIDIAGINQPLQQIQGELTYDGITTSLRSVKAKYGNLDLKAQGKITPDRGLDLDLGIAPFDLEPTLASLDISPALIPLKGKVEVKGKLTGKQPAFSAEVIATSPLTIDRVVVDQSQFMVSTKNFQTWSVNNLTARSDLGAVTGAGTFLLGETPTIDLQLTAAGLGAETIADRYEFALPFGVGNVSGRARLLGSTNNLSLEITANAPEAEYPLTATATIAQGITTIDRVNINLPGGAVTGNGTITPQGWSGKLNTDGFTVNQRTLIGDLDVVSPKGSFNLPDLQARAQISLPQGFAQTKEAIRTEVNWNGKNLEIDRLDVGNLLSAKGSVELELNDQQLPRGLGEIDLQVTSTNTNVANLRQVLPDIPQPIVGNVDFKGAVTGRGDRLQVDGTLQGREITIEGAGEIPEGTIDFDSTVRGKLLDPQIKGRMVLASLAYRSLEFEPLLVGDFAVQPSQGLEVDLRGEQDKIKISLNEKWQPQDLEIQLQDALAQAKPIGENRLGVQVKNFPLALIAAPLGETGIAGDISGEGQVNLGDKFRTVGKLEVDRPRFGRIQAEKLTASLDYNNGNAFLRDGNLEINLPDRQTNYQFDLAYTPQAPTRLMGNLSIEDGRIQDIAQLMQWNRWEDIAKGIAAPQYAKTIALQPFPQVGLPQVSLQKQLNYFSQIQQRLIQQEIAAAASNTLPPLTDLDGSLSGKISIQDRAKTGLGIQVDLGGQNWEYGKLAVEDVALKGEFRNGTVTIGDIRLQSGTSLGELKNARLALVDPKTGKLGDISGELNLNDFPIESLRPLPFFRVIPVEVTGKVKGKANLGGNLLQPKAKGNLKLTEGTISQEPIEAIDGEFDYNSGRFKFASTLSLTDAPPMRLSGDIPLQIGYVFPGNKLQLDLEVTDRALAFINLINPSLRWIDGKGEAKISISGTTQQPKLVGAAAIEGAEIQVAGLPGEITNLNGTIKFDFDRVNTDLTGKFSQGELVAKGTIPITNENLTTENPLTLVANKLQLDLKDTYTGGLNGELAINGSLQNPIVTGMVSLSEGRIPLIEAPIEKNGNGKVTPGTITLRNLKVQLGDNIQISRDPLLNFLGKGEIEVNGTLEDIRPSGRIAIIKGQVNAISARFRLDRSYDSFAEFLPAQGLDPNLNVRVLGAVPEVTRPPIESSPFDSFNPGSIPVSNLGAQRTLQIQATVVGRASNPTIELRSSPPRTQSEILALIGGGLLTQTGGDPTAALVNLAGGTIISFFQDAIGEVLNLSEFNLSPVTTSSDGRRISALGLAAEGAIDVSRDFSVSIRSVINDPSQTTSYTLRYRLNPNTLIRTNTDLKGNNSTTIEFENRF